MTNSKTKYLPFLVYSIISVVLVLLLFRESFSDGMVVFSSDGPLSTLVTSHNQLPDAFAGKWQDINRLGKPAGAAPVNLTWCLLWISSPVFFAKFYIPICLILFGFSIWCFMRCHGFSHYASGLTGLAGILNSNFFSYGAWGLGTIVLSASFFFLAICCWKMRDRFNNWVSALTCGLCIGLMVMEGFDVGIILSFLFALCVLWSLFSPENRKATSTDSNASQSSEEPSKAGWKSQAPRFVVTVLFSMLVAMQTVFSLFSTQVQGVSVLEENHSGQSKWDWATQWSLPVNETIRLAIPGYFGYRMDTPNGGSYRGNVGRDPQFGKDQIPRIPRHSGSGFYAGNFVLFSLGLALLIWWRERKPQPGSDNFFDAHSRHWILFWAIIVFVSLGLSYGRHFVLYGIIHPLPFFSSIRNPIKFLHPATIGILVLFGIFLQAVMKTGGKNWVSLWKSDRAVRLYVLGVPVLAALFFLSQAGSRVGFTKSLNSKLGPEGYPPDLVSQMSQVVMMESLWFLIFTSFSAGVLFFAPLIFRMRSGVTYLVLLIGLFMTFDMGRANLPWIQHFDANAKYQKDELIKALEPVATKDGARVTVAPFENDQYMNIVAQLYRAEWLQHQFPYYDINSIDVPQEPRPMADFAQFQNALSPTNNPARLRRFWELTSCRYILGLNQGVTELLNQEFDTTLKRFSVMHPFSIDQAAMQQNNSVQTIPSPQGPFAVVEFDGALPRVNLYQEWEVIADDATTLSRLGDLAWNPAQSVFVNSPIPKSSSTPGSPASGSVSVKEYSPIKWIIEVEVSSPSVLMLTDNFAPSWQVSVNGKKSDLLRCNFICRGVYLEASPEKQIIEFHYNPATSPLKITVASIVTGIIALFFLLFSGSGAGRIKSNDATPTTSDHNSSSKEKEEPNSSQDS